MAERGRPVGLKSTDNVVEKALKMGAVSQSETRAVHVLAQLKADVITCGGCMGAAAAGKAGSLQRCITLHTSLPRRYGECCQIMEKKVDILRN